MVQVIQPGTSGADLVAENLGSNLKGLLDFKMNQMLQQQQRERTSQGLKALGLPSELAQMDPTLLQHIVPQYMKTQQAEQKQRAIGSILGQPGAESGMPGEPMQAGSLLTPSEADIQNQYKQEMQKAHAMISIDENLGKSMMEQAQTNKNEALKRLQRTKTEAAKTETEDYKLEEPVRVLRQDADREIERNQNARELIEEGNFSSPTWVAMLDLLPKGIGNAFLTNDTKKLQAMGPGGFLKDIKPIFGPQISDSDIQEMYKAIVSAKNSREQNLAILDMFDKAAESKAAKADLYDEIKERYPGRSTVKKLEMLDKEWSKRLRARSKESKEEAQARRESRETAPEGLKSVGTFKQEPKAVEHPNKVLRFGNVFKKSINGQWVEGDWDPVAKIFTPKLGGFPTSSAGLFSKPTQLTAG